MSQTPPESTPPTDDAPETFDPSIYTSPPSQPPSVSRDIHYVAYNGQCLAAKVIGVNDDGTVDVVLWTNLIASHGKKNFGMQFHAELVADHETQAHGTWHWPERV